MTSFSWWLANRISQLLDQNERHAVLGDFAESSLSGNRVLRETLGLVFRRQVELWKDWRPWLALLGVAGLAGALLNFISLSLSGLLNIQIRTYWKHGVRYGDGLTIFEETVLFLCQGIAVMAWSWASGFVLGSLSRRTLWITGTLSCFFSLCPLFLAVFFFAWAHSLAWLVLTLQTIVQFLLFVFPLLAGMRLSAGGFVFSLRQVNVLIAASCILAALAIWTGGWSHAAVVRWSGGAWDASAGWPGRLLFYGAASWPVGYLFITTQKRKTV